MADNTVAFDSQVGGHPGLRVDADGSRIIKPCLPAERHFYETVINADAEEFKLLSKHVPTFYGVTPAVADEKEGLVLENVSHRFTKPNILDIKLGTVLYDDHATEEKKQRMIRSAKETTSLETGVRITGFQVYDSTTDESIQTGKPYGRALTASRLPEAMARFFPIRRPFAQLGAPNPVSEGGQELADGTRSPAGTKPELLLPVLQGVLSAVKEIEEAVRRTSMRMVGGSILVIYEGEENALQTALAHLDQREETGPAYAVKVIDFAHTKLEEGLGPDEGVLFGLKTTIGLLQGRIQEVQEAMASTENVA